MPALPILKLMGTLPLISPKTDVVLHLKSQYTRLPCVSACVAGNVPLPSLLQYVTGRHLSLLQLYCYVEGNKGPFAMGFQKSLQHQSLGIQGKFLQCLGMSDCSMCQCTQPKLLPGVSTTKWPAQDSVTAIIIPWDYQWLSVPSSLVFSV